jgi:dihydroorotate dehydrogenase electron transfer subunit
MDQQLICTVTENRVAALDTQLMILNCEQGLKSFVPGQFVHVQVPNRPDLLLRRPFSIHAYDEKRRELTLVYQVKGKGTRAFADCSPGDVLSVLGPLGRGFPVKTDIKRGIVVGGGIGCAPLLSLPVLMPHVVFDAALGFRNAACIFQKSLFENACNRVIWTTDDGSFGRKGFAADALKDLLEQPCDAVFACGPKPMLQNLQAFMKGLSIPCYASLEERMGCGIGACVTCTVVVIESCTLQHKRVCKDGPVFDLSEVIL